MNKIASLSNDKRDKIFNFATIKLGINKNIIEKDFWVTFLLDFLFDKSIYKEYFVFKGGTSLSKCFNLINRFSEDIDIILNHNLLTKEDIFLERTKTKQDKFNVMLNKEAANFIKEKLAVELDAYLKKILIEKYKVFVDNDDPQVLIFEYPKSDKNNDGYLLNHVRIEIGPIASLIPNCKVKISPILTKVKEIKIYNSIVQVISTTPERTFYEKILILHQQCFRPMDKNIPSRYSRHYYDVYKIAHSPYKDSALENITLLNNVRDFKNKFYYTKWSRYDLAKVGTIKLVPNEERIRELEKDYFKMKEMIYDKNLISFTQIIDYLKQLEAEINRK